MIDLIIAGGGPVGLATAITAVTSGLQVVVVEPRDGPIDKACGEGLMPDAVARLNALGVDPAGVRITGIRYLASSRTAEARFSAGLGRGVRRTVLHDAMKRRALEVGVRIEPGRVVDVAQSRDGVRADGRSSRYLVGADGLHSTVRRSAGLATPPSRARRFGLRQHFQVTPWTDLVEVHWLPDREVYVTPVSADSVGVAILGQSPLNMSATISRLPALAARLAGATAASAPRGAGPFRQGSTARVAGRVLLVGDAAGYVDALTGEGLRIGFAEATAAVGAILRDRPKEYEADWRQITRSYRTTTNTLLRIGASPARSMIVPLARAMRRTFTRLVDQVAG